MKRIILIVAIAATTISCAALAVSAAAPTEEQCNTATNPGNISPWVSTEVNDKTLEVNVAGAYGLKSKLEKMYRYKANGQEKTKWLKAKSYAWQLPDSAVGTEVNVKVWVCAYKKNQWVKGQYTHTQQVPAPPTPTPAPPTATPRPTLTPTPTPEPQIGIESNLFNYVGWSGRIGDRRPSVGCSEYDSTTKACPDDMPAPFMEQLRTAADQWDAVLDTENPVDLQILLTQNQTARTILIADDDGNPQKAYLALPYGCQNTEGFCGGKGLLVHELGHGLGMARNVPRFWDLVVNSKFTGEKATDAHQGESVPMYNPGDGIEAHWGGSVNDIMSWDGDFTNPTISDVTIGAFSDIGYTTR